MTNITLLDINTSHMQKWDMNYTSIETSVARQSLWANKVRKFIVVDKINHTHNYDYYFTTSATCL